MVGWCWSAVHGDGDGVVGLLLKNIVHVEHMASLIKKTNILYLMSSICILG
jgi:hypothetical protein